jgi:uncharacterized protein (TIGR02996 family)
MARRQPAPDPPRPEVLAFLQDIKANPADDAPRLILSDWLEEHDDPARAEFVRVQVELARAPQHLRRQVLLERERELLAQHAAGWLPPLDPQAVTGSFHRGLVRLTVVGRDVAVPRPTRVKWPVHPPRAGLQFGKRPLLELLDQAETEAYAWVDSLAFHGLCPEDAAVLAAPALRQLVTLDLSCAAVGDAGARALAGSPATAGLTTLLLPGNGLTCLGAEALAASPHLARLTTLNLARNYLGPDGGRALAGAASLTGLTILDLHQCGIGDAGLVALAFAPGLGRLAGIDLDGNQIGDEGAEALAAAPHLAGLTSLDLRGNRIGSAGARALAESPYLGRLECLQLYSNRLTDADVLLLRERFGRKVWL